MNRQEKIKHLNNSDWKVTISMQGNSVYCRKGQTEKKYNSVNEAHKKIFGY